MAFVFSPKYQQEELVEALTQEQLLALSVETVKDLDWQVSFISPKEIIVHTSTSIFSVNQVITITINENNVHFKSESSGFRLLDMERNKYNATLYFNKLKYFQETISVELLEKLSGEIAANIASKEYNHLNQPHKSAKDKIGSFFSLFIPKEGFYITPIIININIALFILMLFYGAGFITPNYPVLIQWGANFKVLTLDYLQWWRLFSTIFIHAGFIHLLMNMIALLYIGLFLEPFLGKIRYAVFYLLTGLAASTASLFWHEDLSVCVGASGAIFGLYGIFLALLTTNLIEKTARKVLLPSIVIFIFYSLLNGLKGNIDNAAHLGGLLSGIILGYGVYFSLKDSNNKKLKRRSVSYSSALVIFLSTFVYVQLPLNYTDYDDGMKEFAKLDSIALQFYTNPTNDIRVSTYQIVDGLRKWERCNQILDGLDKLELPIEYRNRNTKLREYVKLRNETYTIIHEAIVKDTLIDDELIRPKTSRIVSILKELKSKEAYITN